MATVPTGLSGVPPSGPAMPVMPRPTVAPARARTPVRHRLCDRLADRAVRGNQIRWHAQQVGLGLVAVARRRQLHVRRAAGHVGQPRGQQPARARLRGGHRVPALAQERPDHGFHRSFVVGIDVFAEHLHQRAHGLVQPGRSCRRLGAAEAQVEVDAARGRQRGRRDCLPLRRPRCDHRARDLLGVRLGLPGDADHPRQHARCAGARRQALANQGFHHRLQLAWRPRQQHDDPAGVFEPQARRACRWGSARIVRAIRHHRLSPVDLRHLQRRAWQTARATARRARGLPAAGAPAPRPPTSRVTSSSVGPRPPVSTTRSARVTAPENTTPRSARESPTTALARTLIPCSARTP